LADDARAGMEADPFPPRSTFGNAPLSVEGSARGRMRLRLQSQSGRAKGYRPEGSDPMYCE